VRIAVADAVTERIAQAVSSQQPAGWASVAAAQSSAKRSARPSAKVLDYTTSGRAQHWRALYAFKAQSQHEMGIEAGEVLIAEPPAGRSGRCALLAANAACCASVDS